MGDSATDRKLKHLEFIQQVVSRMASNLFLLKGWTITLIAALFALAAKDSKDAYFVIAYVPAFMFWMLDGYFLSQERRFRALYDYVRELPEDKINFSMDTRPFKRPFEWPKAAFSSTLILYYGVLIATMLAVQVVVSRR